MNFIKKTRTKNWVVMLYKLTDQISAEKFDMESTIQSCIKRIEDKTGLSANSFDVNFQKFYKTKNGFEKALKSYKELVYCFVGFNSIEADVFFSISNEMLNLNEKPEKATIDFCLQISTTYFNEKSILEFNKNLIDDLDFDYGYATLLDSNFSALTERKIKKGFFSSSTKIIAKDFNWRLNKTNILNGALKKLYSINYLNESHFTNLEQKNIISKIGNLSKVNNRIYKWSLLDLEIEQLNNEKSKELNLTE